MKSPSRLTSNTASAQKTLGQDVRKISWALAVYYYGAMLLCLLVLFGGANLAAHGFFRAATKHTVAITECVPPNAQITDASKLSALEKQCNQDEQDIQVRQGSFQMAQGLTMVTVALVVFAWHLRRIRSFELQLR